jgi:hypothetical protein
MIGCHAVYIPLEPSDVASVGMPHRTDSSPKTTGEALALIGLFLELLTSLALKITKWITTVAFVTFGAVSRCARLARNGNK